MTDKEYIIKRLKEIYKKQCREFTKEDEEKTLKFMELLERIKGKEIPVKYVDNLKTDIEVKGSVLKIKSREKEVER